MFNLKQWKAGLIANRRVIALCLILCVESVLAFSYWKSIEDPIVGGYLVKFGNQYIVAWKRRGHYLEWKRLPTLPESLRFARIELKLSARPIASPTHHVGSVKLVDVEGRYRVLWGTKLAFSNRLTFRDKRDAMFFANAFRTGGYSTSPLGHAIVLMPIRTY